MGIRNLNRKLIYQMTLDVFTETKHWDPHRVDSQLHRVMQEKAGKGDMDLREIRVCRDVNLIRLSRVLYYHFTWA
jgi:hypothetical protein